MKKNYTTEAQFLMANGQKFTNEQLFFCMGFDLIGSLTDDEGNPISEEAKEKIRDIKEQLWKKVYKYAQRLMLTMTDSFFSNSDDYNEMNQDMVVKFYETLKDYNPLKAAPTTFFKSQFQEVIGKYIRKNCQHLTQNDASNLAKVRKAIKAYEERGITNPDIKMIAEEAGLSVNVVNNTLFYAKNAKYASVEDAYGVASNRLTPEQDMVARETEEDIINTIKDILLDKEYDFFLCKVNLDGDKEKNYRQLSKEFNMKLNEVKAYYTYIVSKLASSAKLQSYAHVKNGIDFNLSLQENLLDENEEELIKLLKRLAE